MKLFYLPVIFAGALVLSACDQKEAEPESNSAADVEATSSDTGEQLDSEVKKVSYAMGLNLGERFRTDEIDLDVGSFTDGMTAGNTDSEPQMTPEEIATTMQAFQKKQMAKMQEQQAEMQKEQEAAGAENAAAGKAFLEENAKKKGIEITESGLQYKVISDGEGPKPAADDIVSVHYKGTFLDGKEFDSSYSRGEPAEFPVDQVIPGWTEALQLMQVGSKWELYIPADLAYGPGGAGGEIGPNSTLKFEVELLDIKDKEAADKEAAETADKAKG